MVTGEMLGEGMCGAGGGGVVSFQGYSLNGFVNVMFDYAHIIINILAAN